MKADRYVAITIYSSVLPMGTGQGLYFTSTATELDPNQVEWAIHATSARAGKVINRTAADYLNESCRRCFEQPLAMLKWRGV